MELWPWPSYMVSGTTVNIGINPLWFTAKKTLKELRQLMFQMKDEVFGYSRGGYACNTEALERILKEVFGDMKMDDIKYPRYKPVCCVLCVCVLCVLCCVVCVCCVVLCVCVLCVCVVCVLCVCCVYVCVCCVCVCCVCMCV